MDPWLEGHWGDVHQRIVTYACDRIEPQLPPDLFARVEETMYIVSPTAEPGVARPDVAVVERPHGAGGGAIPAAGEGVAVAEPVRVKLPVEPVTLGHIEIRTAKGRRPLVTAIEIVSPANKFDRAARRTYRRKRRAYYSARANVVEIDLLRRGRPLIDVPANTWAGDPHLDTPYRACVRPSSPGDVDPWADYYPMPLRRRLPAIRIPLRRGRDESVVLDVQAVLEQAYVRGRYAAEIDYDSPPPPPLLSPADAAWAAEQVAAWRRVRAGGVQA